MGFRHNNVLHGNHFRKDWQERVRTWFDQAGRKHSRRAARKEKAAKTAPRPLQLLRPAVRCTTVRYNMRIRQGRGFSLEELKTAGVNRKEALSIGIPVDHRRRNRSEESLKRNVERLTAYKERLIVLPRKHSGKKAKKVEKPSIEGSTRDLASILPLPSGITSEEPRAITSEEKEFDAYKTLRNARASQRFAGKIAARAAKKAEEDAAKKK